MEQQNNPIVIQLNDVNEIIGMIVLVILGIGTLIQTLDMIGILPDKWRNRFKLNRAQDTLEVLRTLGININQYKKRNSTIGIPVDYSEQTVVEKQKNV